MGFGGVSFANCMTPQLNSFSHITPLLYLRILLECHPPPPPIFFDYFGQAPPKGLFFASPPPNPIK